MNFSIISILIPCFYIQPDHFLREQRKLSAVKEQKLGKSDCLILTWESFEESVNLSNRSFLNYQRQIMIFP